MKDRYKIRAAISLARNNLLRFIMSGICIALVFAAGVVPVQAQDFTVTGTVLSAENQEPLPGVNILEVGTQRGATTNEDGEFTIEVSSSSATLRFTFVGFTTRTVDINGRSQLTVELTAQTEALDDVVVTALGLERQSKSLGYSVSEVSSEDLVTGTETNTANLLQGQIAGVNVSPTSGGPGSSSRVTIRGASSLNGNNQPLYVVDGVPIDNTNFGSAGKFGGFDGGDGISQINSANIESISVLKGASAAALYGSRARDGVVQITTKSGSGDGRQGPAVNFSSTVTLNDPLTSFEDYQRKYGQGTLGEKPQTQAIAVTTGAQSWGAPLDGSPVVQFDGQQRPYSDQGNQAENFYRTGISSKNTLSLSGGDENSTYYFSSTYQNSESVVPNSGLETISLTLRGTHSFGKLDADVKVNYIDESTNNRTNLSDSPGNPNFGIAILPPNVSTSTLKNNYITEEGREIPFQNNPFVTNPYWAVNQWDTDDKKERIIGHVDLKYDITEWASLRARTGLDRYTLRRTSFTPWGTAYRVDGEMFEDEFRVMESTTDVLLNVNKELTSSFTVKGTLGGTVNYRKNETVGIVGSVFKVPKLRTISNMANISPNYDFAERQINSVYGSAEIAYNDYLFLTVTGRNDWSSTLPEGENAFFYPSISTSFVFSEAFSSAMPSWLSFGKVRASWAEVGSDADPYQLNLTYSLLPFTHQDQSFATITQDAIPLADLKPTSTEELEIGLDLRFFDDRLGLDISWYDRQTTNQILSTTVSNATGFGDRVINAGRMDNGGFEILLKGTPISSANLFWETSFNYSRNESEVVALAGEQEELILQESRTGNARITARIGEEYGTIKGYAYKRDANGNIVHENGLPVQSDEQQILGKGTPDWTLGWNNTFSYKNLSLTTLIDVKWGGQLYSDTNSYAYVFGLHKNTLEGRAACDEAGTPYSSCFTAEGVDINGGPNNTAVVPEAYYGSIGGADGIAEEFVYDANFIKLRQLMLSYRLPQSLLANIPVQSATISAIGRNLFYIYDSVPNVDPEAGYNRGNSQGLELAGVPGARSFGLSINLGF